MAALCCTSQHESLYLYNDAGNSITGPLTPGGPGSLSNSQCTLSGPGSSASGAGNTLTLNLAESFTLNFQGVKTIYGAVTDNAMLTSGGRTWEPSRCRNRRRIF